MNPTRMHSCMEYLLHRPFYIVDKFTSTVQKYVAPPKAFVDVSNDPCRIEVYEK